MKKKTTAKKEKNPRSVCNVNAAHIKTHSNHSHYTDVWSEQIGNRLRSSRVDLMSRFSECKPSRIDQQGSQGLFKGISMKTMQKVLENLNTAIAHWGSCCCNSNSSSSSSANVSVWFCSAVIHVNSAAAKAYLNFRQQTKGCRFCVFI